MKQHNVPWHSPSIKRNNEMYSVLRVLYHSAEIWLKALLFLVCLPIYRKQEKWKIKSHSMFSSDFFLLLKKNILLLLLCFPFVFRRTIDSNIRSEKKNTKIKQYIKISSVSFEYVLSQQAARHWFKRDGILCVCVIHAFTVCKWQRAHARAICLSMGIVWISGF